MTREEMDALLKEHAKEFEDMSDAIWGFAETCFEEKQSMEIQRAYLEEKGFRTTAPAYNVVTAMMAEYGQGKPVIAILGEYDALHNMSQVADVTRCEPLEGSNKGHGCGHQLLGTAAVEAAFAVKEYMEANKLPGTVRYLGCPAEEGGAGKIYMLRSGAFDDVDVAISWHPGSVSGIWSNALSTAVGRFFFRGKAAHAAANPDQGRSALDAAELMNVGVQFLREHTKRTDSIHYSFLDVGGPSPNVVQPTARVLYMVRSDTVRNAKKLLARVDNVARGAALMTDTQVSIRQIDGTSNTLSNAVLEKVLYDKFKQVPMPQYSEGEWDLAEKLFDTYEKPDLPGEATKLFSDIHRFVEEKTECGKRPVNDFLIPYVHSSLMSQGSTDVGDVSWLTPTAQFNAVTWPSCAPGHSWQVVSVGKSSFAHKGMLLAAKVLACTVANLMEQPDLLAQARNEFAVTAREGYDCPLGPEVKPTAVV